MAIPQLFFASNQQGVQTMTALLIPAFFLLQLFTPVSLPPQTPFYGPAFSLAVTPTRPVMVQGGSASFTIHLAGDQPASFSVRIEGIPSSVSAEIPHVGLGSSTIVLHSLPGTPHGTYAIQVTAAAGSNQQTQTFALDIKPLHPTP